MNTPFIFKRVILFAFGHVVLNMDILLFQCFTLCPYCSVIVVLIVTGMGLNLSMPLHELTQYLYFESRHWQSGTLGVYILGVCAR